LTALGGAAFGVEARRFRSASRSATPKAVTASAAARDHQKTKPIGVPVPDFAACGTGTLKGLSAGLSREDQGTRVK